MGCIKVVVLGPEAVGKTAIVIRLVNKTFQERYDPTIEDCFQTVRTVHDKTLRIDILDTAGQDAFASVKQQYMISGNGFLMVYSITSTDSFDRCKESVDMLLKIRDANVPWVLVGNKCDLDSLREVETSTAAEYAQNMGAIQSLEVSAKENINVEDALLTLVDAVIVSRLSSQTTDKKNCCML